jgi:hypothetical protein
LIEAELLSGSADPSSYQVVSRSAGGGATASFTS